MMMAVLLACEVLAGGGYSGRPGLVKRIIQRLRR